MIRIAVVGLGKMGLSHLAMIRPHPQVEVAAVCDSAGYLLDVLSKYTGLRTYSDYHEMLEEVPLDAVVIATPSASHAGMVRAALERGLHVFCEKPLFLDPADGEELTALASQRGLVTQVGYHNRYVGAFREVKRLLDAGAIGTVTSVRAEAYGPVVLKPAGRTWRNKAGAGGGCLYDYAAHPLDLVTWYFGMPEAVRGSRLLPIFSKEIDDAVISTLCYPDGLTVSLNTNWSDESQRKMTTSVSLWGTDGRIYADRQEVRVYLRKSAALPPGYDAGWTVKYTTELSQAPWFYLRGEEYSAQLDDFVQRVAQQRTDGINTFASGTVTDRVIDLIVQDAGSARADVLDPARPVVGAPRPALGAPRRPRRRGRDLAERIGTTAASAWTGIRTRASAGQNGGPGRPARSRIQTTTRKERRP